MKYSNIFDSVDFLFSEALRRLGFNCHQAFAYAYDEMELIRRGKNGFESLATFTALFVFAKKNGVDFPLDDDFANDVLAELRKVYEASSCDLNEFDLSLEEKGRLISDMKIVSETFLA
ncbi:hypothetical protein MJ904_25460 [Massilia sp. MB5]|uniref:hypothetical protein n=1 Tax=Massilia sp. MB5 TaxID=2919578 RepID=UPI001F1172F1|nr:hypothetical protein [Massilia sp. MB5]UMR30294.1 hypothetical protein MJ904_25460 [Massilia sp. MB5]